MPRHADYREERYAEISVDEADLHDIDYETAERENRSLFDYENPETRRDREANA